MIVNSYLIGTMVVALAAQTAVIWRLASRMKAVERIPDRLSRFAEALALLTDTTEAGLSALAGEIEHAGRRRTPRASASNPRTRRIMSAMKSGRSIEEIAADEQLSHSEIRLHLDLGEAPHAARGEHHGALRG